IDVFQRGVSTIDEKTSPSLASDFYALLGDLYYQEGMKREAYCAYDSCLQWQEDNIGCLNNYAYYLSIEDKDLDRAEKMSYKTIKKDKENSTYIDTYAWILFKQKRYSEARIYIDKAIEHLDSISSTTEIYDHAGDIYYYNGETDKAVEFWNKALQLQPDDKLLQKKIRKRKYFKL
ncbi:MAG: tetratricopeptide repeat protein, partial [Prevotellaceae bacterium]|nr:tetratricopeptide repeat protein [Prevotellaceae bacterium]